LGRNDYFSFADSAIGGLFVVMAAGFDLTKAFMALPV